MGNAGTDESARSAIPFVVGNLAPLSIQSFATRDDALRGRPQGVAPARYF
jgi:hypothetical protein